MGVMARSWKVTERAINRHLMDALRAEIAGRRLTITAAAQAAGFTQQQLSNWLNADENGGETMSAGRFVAIVEANGLDGAKVFADGVQRARDAQVFSAVEQALEDQVAGRRDDVVPMRPRRATMSEAEATMRRQKEHEVDARLPRPQAADMSATNDTDEQ